MSQKAIASKSNTSKCCVLCYNGDTPENKDLKFFELDDFSAVPEYVCEKCLKNIKELRMKCHKHFEDPSVDIFDDFVPDFIKESVPCLENWNKNSAK